jgi:hypothetical protein
MGISSTPTSSPPRASPPRAEHRSLTRPSGQRRIKGAFSGDTGAWANCETAQMSQTTATGALLRRLATVAFVRQSVELRSRSEYAADLEQRVAGGWTELPFRFRSRETTSSADTSHSADSIGSVIDGRVHAGTSGDAANTFGSPPDGRGADRLDTPLELLRRFEPRRAGLPEISAGDAAAYLDAHHIDPPWLAAARSCPPEVQRIFAALDQGSGHAKPDGPGPRTHLRQLLFSERSVCARKLTQPHGGCATDRSEDRSGAAAGHSLHEPDVTTVDDYDQLGPVTSPPGAPCRLDRVVGGVVV